MDGAAYAVDLGSMNATSVGAAIVRHEPRMLQPDDRISLSTRLALAVAAKRGV